MLRKKVQQAMMTNYRLIGLLIIENNCHPQTMLKWIKTNDVMLTTAANLAIIVREMKLSQEQILEPAKAR